MIVFIAAFGIPPNKGQPTATARVTHPATEADLESERRGDRVSKRAKPPHCSSSIMNLKICSSAADVG